MNAQDDLAMRMKASVARGRSNYYAGYTFLIIGVLASAATTISVAATALTPEINATLAALPGIVVMVLKIFKFEQRSKWWWNKYHGLLRIQAGQRPDGSNAAEIKLQVAEFLTKHYEDWPGPQFDKPQL